MPPGAGRAEPILWIECTTPAQFSGPSRQQGLFEAQGGKGVFTWNDGSSTRLWVKIDEVANPYAQCDDHRTNLRENGEDSFWKRGGGCVDVRTTFNRYQSFTCANPSERLGSTDLVALFVRTIPGKAARLTMGP